MISATEGAGTSCITGSAEEAHDGVQQQLAEAIDAFAEERRQRYIYRQRLRDT